MIPLDDFDLGLDVPVFDGINVLKYLNEFHGFNADDLIESELPINDPDRCTTIIVRGGVRLRCSFAGVDKWESSGITVWNRCEDCMNERALFLSYGNRVEGRIQLHGDNRRFRAE